MSPIITITPAATAQIADMIKKDPTHHFMRISVEGGGCFGFKYVFTMDHNLKDDDHVLEDGVAKVAIDELSIPFLKGSILNYEQDLIRSGFVLTNPNAEGGCGCGNSFSIDPTL
jgi:iron-sulfur cluster assembly accessory protein